MTECKHKNWVAACHADTIEYELGIKPRDQQPVFRVLSIYEVYCKDCNNFVNLITGETINDKDLVVIRPSNVWHSNCI